MRRLLSRRIFCDVRIRILSWYVILMAFSTLVSIVTIRQVLLVSLQERAETSLVQEVQEFRQLTKKRNPITSQPFKDDVAALFDVFLCRNIPNEDEFFITLLNGRFYRSSPEALPPSLHRDSMVNWAKLTQPQSGKKVTPFDTFLYMAEPVIRGKTHGVFVVVHSNNGNHKQVNQAFVVVLNVMIAVLVGASVLAWIVAGRALAPLRLLSETAQSISGSDLSRRIPVQGADEIAELTVTFNQMLDRLQSTFTSQRDFINDASHELRTPITIIQGHLELLGDDPQERREMVELVIDELNRMSRFVDDLLLLAKAEQPKFLNLETVDIGLLTEGIYAKAKALAPRNWILESKGTGRIVVDSQRLTQAMMNLAQNAAQHTSDGDIIALGSALTDGSVRFWVRDTGVGISLADQQRIFERFARGSHSRRSEGAGLGLSIVRAIAILHGGRVELSSQPGNGSTFTIILPLDPPQEVLSA